MTRKFAALAGELSLDDLRRLLVVKERLAELEARRGVLESELAKIRSAIAEVIKGGADGAAPTAVRRGRGKARKPVGRKKTVKKAAKKPAKAKGTTKAKGKTKAKGTTKAKAAAKKVVRRKTAARKVIAKKATAKKAVAKKTVAKKAPAAKKAAAKKPTPKKKAAGKKAAGRAPGKQTLEAVVAGLIRANGGAMSVQDILRAIAKGKLVKSRSRNFSNVLRRTLSTSTILVSAGRGLYKVK
jgi:hypothetical protein